ncbi:unnamed protein product [Pieris brassicae]|uniref:RecA family profile 1 domain-containing protein n=1 Tax=Pieris brassicae TaxID=7116 RepID=A0A9P0XJ24_PIEBR|nr:unnamed protein product [Pieris brassicae]
MTNLKNIMPPNMYDVIEGAGICTVKEIINLSTWDIQKLTNMKEEDINFLKNLVARYYCPKIITAEKLEKYSHIKTGCSGFDDILNGGFRVGTLSEIYGESGAGKTQLALQIAAQCGKDGSIYICTEDAFPVKRFNQLLEYHSHQASCSEYREKIFIEHITESQDLLSCVRVRLPKLLEQKKVSVIIVDSIAAPFRVDVTNYVHRAEELRELEYYPKEVIEGKKEKLRFIRYDKLVVKDKTQASSKNSEKRKRKPTKESRGRNRKIKNQNYKNITTQNEHQTLPIRPAVPVAQNDRNPPTKTQEKDRPQLSNNKIKSENDNKNHYNQTFEKCIIKTGGVRKAFKELTNSMDCIVKLKLVENLIIIEQTYTSATYYYKKLSECNHNKSEVELPENSEIPNILHDEVEKAIDTQRNDKAPGPDGINN